MHFVMAPLGTGTAIGAQVHTSNWKEPPVIDPASMISPLILGIVEGLTEFLPVSSTGHLILAEKLLGYEGEQAGIVDVVIQVGAILAICWLYRERLFKVAFGLFTDLGARQFAINILIAFLPAVVVGALAHDFIKHVLFSPLVVACSLIVGGVAIILIERWIGARAPAAEETIEHLPPLTALKIGLCQLLALIPGVSRSGATIMGAVSLGVNRKTAAEFSFFLAIPTMFGAAALDIYKGRNLINHDTISAIAVGSVAAFIVAMFVVKWLVNFVGKHGFTVFGWYRIAIGLVTLGLLAMGR
jgi:undecaprenyl-diphosphatase